MTSSFTSEAQYIILEGFLFIPLGLVPPTEGWSLVKTIGALFPQDTWNQEPLSSDFIKVDEPYPSTMEQMNGDVPLVTMDQVDSFLKCLLFNNCDVVLEWIV